MEVEQETWKERRTKELGYKPQHEIFHNFYLPYTANLDEESSKLLDHIKQELGKTLALREINPGAGIFVSKLMSYIKLYGLKFSKEDHVKLVKALLEIIIIPHLDPSKLNKCCACLSHLLRKSTLLSPDDLQINWRPLYELAKIYIDKRCSKGDLIRFFPMSHDAKKANPFNHWIMTMAQSYGITLPDQLMPKVEQTLEQNIHFVIQLCAPYFPNAANKEILDELLPQLQPLDIGKSDSVMEMLSLFLNPNSFELWFDDLMSFWETYHYPPWNMDIWNLVAAAAANTIGLIDWNPHIPTMFVRILRSLDLPVSYKQMKSAKNQQICPDATATWIVSVLGPKTDAMKYLRSFMSTIESYLHPANSGKWVRTISELLVQLVKYFHERLISEKYKKHPWKRQIPDDYKLRESDITEFVEIFKPVAFQAMYSRIGPNDISRVFKGLADLRPELILPGILDRVFTTIDSITEPHKFTSALSSLASIAHVMASGRRGSEMGKSQVIPLLFAVLPGIDSNDFKKTSITLQYIITQSILIPFIDCSKASLYWDDLTEDEHLICEQTAQFEDFVLQFLDRIFVLIESSSVESTRMEHTSHMDNLKSKLESISEALIQSASHSVLGQCSQEILDSCTKKMVNYVKSHLLEPRVAGPAMSTLCRVFARVNGKDVYRALLPYLIGSIENYFNENDDVIDLEKQNDEFLYHLVLLSNLVRGNSTEIQEYIDEIIPVMDKLLKCKCKITNRSGANMLTNLLVALSTMQTNDVKTVPEAFTLPLKDFLPVRHWARKMSREESFDWFMPGKKERDACEKLIHHYLLPILAKFERYNRDEEEISREDMTLHLYVVTGILKCNNFLANWTEDPIQIVKTVTKHTTFDLSLGYDGLSISMPDGTNIRLAIMKTMHKLQEKILEKSEDDIKSLKQLIAVYEKVHYRSHSNSTYESQSKSYLLSKQFQDFKLCRTRKDIRAVVATRVIIQQDLRDEVSAPLFNKTHRQLMLDMIKLSTSHYSAVRSTAQSKLFKMFNIYPFAYRTIVDEIAQCLKLDPNEHHEEFKGGLYLIGTNRRHRLILRPDWEIVEKLWLALLKTQLSEKLSILRLMDSITDGINNEFQTISTSIQVSDKVAQMGFDLLVNKEELPADFMKLGAEQLAAKNEFNHKKFLDVVGSILSHIHENSLHWRYHLLAGTMINDLMHPYSNYPPEVTQMFVHNLIHDSIEERSMALRIVNTVLKQQKREHLKIKIDPFAIAGVPRVEKVKPGIRTDNKWLQYDVSKLPKSQAEWDEPRYMYKINGFFGWTPVVETYAPSAQQPKLDRNINELSDHERHFFEFFNQKSNVDKLIAFWSLEEKKGKEKFNRSRFWLIKSIFDIFGDVFLDSFLSHLPALIENKTNESSHRCAAEIIAGILRGAKHWDYEKTANMYEKVVPFIRMALSNITNETDGFWGTSFATAAEGIDPIKQHFLHEVLLEDPIKEVKSFIDCSRLYCLQGAFNQHVWRMGSVAHRLLEYLRPFLNHPFQNVRERIGSTLINIFENDLNFPGSEQTNFSPRIVELIESRAQEFELLRTQENINHVIETETPFASAIRSFKTIAQWITGILNRCSNGNEVIYLELLAVGARLERCEHDTELAETCSAVLSMIAQALTLPRCMDSCLTKIDEISYSSSWSARLAIIDIMQVLVFHNMAIVLSRPEWVDKVLSVVLRLLEDNVLEVREKSAEVLGGLIHCSFLPTTEELLELFKKKCRTKVIKRSNRVTTSCAVEAATSASDNDNANAIRIRHCGVLGLCAFITAYPYEIPDFVPNVFEIISNHLNDPQPIPTTIRKTLADFKRTHHDGWDLHQLKFNETQLAVLTDLTVPPSYYA